MAAHRLSVFSLLLAALLWGLFWYPLRWLEAHGVPGLWAALVIYGGTLVVALPMLRGQASHLRGYPGLLAVVALGSGWTNTMFILAMLDGNVLRVMLLFYLAPAWATLFGWAFLGERITRAFLLALAIALIGAAVMLWSPQAGMPWPQTRADWLALSAGMAFAITNTAVRRLVSVPIRVKAPVAWLGAVAFALVLLAVGAEPAAAPPLGYAVLVGFVFGAVVMVAMTVAVQYGVSRMPVHLSAVILLSQLVVGAVSAHVLTDEVVLLREWVGGALIALAAYLVGTRRTEKQP
ncbi:DMT family transporter [Ectothiorhodospiraceae bacterium 2226]|nr:DMT family transporter [Ectothiorhodospiraceae bacterium 2226]